MESDSRTVKFEHFQSVRLLFVLKMASRGGSARRVPEKEAAITYVQCDGLVSKRNQYFLFQCASKKSALTFRFALNVIMSTRPKKSCFVVFKYNPSS